MNLQFFEGNRDQLGFSVSRRSFVFRSGLSLGAMAMADLAARSDQPPMGSEKWAGVIKPLHAAPRVKRVIWLYMAGGMSHLDTWDHKPKLEEMSGKPMPESITKGQQIAQLQGAKLVCLAPQHPFQKWGQSGLKFSTIWPQLGANCADMMCMVRSLHTDAINHDPAHTFMNTGSMITGRPAAGSWLWYGLGNEAHDLPGFVVMVSTGKFGQTQPIAGRQWHSGLLPSRFQGVEFRSRGDAVHYVRPPEGVTLAGQRGVVDAVGALDRLRNDPLDDPEVAARLAQFELAFRMQSSVPELVDFSGESAETLALYGVDEPKPDWHPLALGPAAFGRQCLLARRLVERGVRFVQIYSGGGPAGGQNTWDGHHGIEENLRLHCPEVDRPIAALLTDLARRGLLDSTLVVWGGEFGRMPVTETFNTGGKPGGRDHNPRGFTYFLAGGGAKGGTAYGATDDFGERAVENPRHLRDLHATILHLLGLDHRRLTYFHGGLAEKLTGVLPAQPIAAVIA